MGIALISPFARTDILFRTCPLCVSAYQTLTGAGPNKVERNFNMIRARDIMTQPALTVTPETSMVDVARLLLTHDITGIPVVDDQMTLLGIITEKDVLDLFEVIQYGDNRTVSSSMSRDVISFGLDDEIDDIRHCLHENSFRRVPIVSDGKVVGIISRHDLIIHMLKARQKHGNGFTLAY
jgi:CBS domain-containing protein